MVEETSTGPEASNTIATRRTMDRLAAGNLIGYLVEAKAGTLLDTA